MNTAFAVLAALAASPVGLAALLWPMDDPAELPHTHDNLPPGHPHLAGAVHTRSGHRHSHALVIDREDPAWPER